MRRRTSTLSKKDLDKYYEVVSQQYYEFKQEIEDFEQLCAQQLVAPEIVANAKKSFEPVKDNWMRLNYVMYLLNKPVKKYKETRYNSQTKKQVRNSITQEQVVAENKEAREKFTELAKN